jgi:hypothetical protein
MLTIVENTIVCRPREARRLLRLIEKHQVAVPLNRADDQAVVVGPRRAAEADVGREIGHFLKRRSARQIEDPERARAAARLDERGHTAAVGRQRS